VHIARRAGKTGINLGVFGPDLTQLAFGDKKSNRPKTGKTCTSR
jgi:hypothetical protein